MQYEGASATEGVLCGQARRGVVNYAKPLRTRVTFDAMTHKNMLFGASLLSVLLLSVHLAHDALRARPGTTEAGPGNIVGTLILFVLLSGPLLLRERRSGQIIMLVTALAAMGMPALHFNLGSNLNKYTEPLFFVWGLIALGMIGLLSLVLLISEWSRGSQRPSDTENR